MNAQFDWYDTNTYGCGWPKKKKSRIKLMDAGTGLMNRKLQRLISRMYNRLKEEGLIDSDIGMIDGELSSGKDFYSFTFGKQVRKYLQFVDDFEKDECSLSVIVSDRNYFIHKYCQGLSEEPDVTDGDLDRLKKLIMTIDKASNRFDGMIKKIQSESKKKSNINNNDNQKRVISIIDKEIKKAGGSATLNQIGTAISVGIKGFRSKEILGMKLGKFIKLNYDVKGKGNDMIIRFRNVSGSKNAAEEDVRKLLSGIVSECKGMKNPSAEIGQRLKNVPGLEYSQYGGKNDLKSFLRYFDISI